MKINLNLGFVRKVLSNRKLVLIIAAVLLLAAIAVGALIYIKTKDTEKDKASEVISSLETLENSEDCASGISQSKDLNSEISSLTDQQKKLEISARVLNYQISCNFKQKKYDEALKKAGELKELYNANNVNDKRREELNILTENIQATKDNAKRDAEKKSQPVQKDTYVGPYL